jgi:hypothetical protein
MSANLNTIYVLNADNSIHWPNYKLYIDARRQTKRKTETKDNMNLNPIPAPYSEAAVNAVCASKETDIPDALFNYLTQVSSCLCISGYDDRSPVVFDLNRLPTKEDASKICIPYETTFLDEDSFYYRDENETGVYEGDDFNRCMVRLTYCGEQSENLYLGSGAHYGSVWRYNNDNEIVWTRTAHTLDDFIITHFIAAQFQT